MAIAIIDVTVILLNMVRKKNGHRVGENETTLLSYILSARVCHTKIHVVVDSSVAYIYSFQRWASGFY